MDICFKTRWCFFLIFILLTTKNVYSQGYWENYELYDTHKGLPGNTILCMTQDNKGLLWIGTENGLCIYDGYEFETQKDIFNTNDGEWKNIFNFLFKDNNGNIWAGTENGQIGMYNGNTDSFTRFNITYPTGGEYITAAYQETDGQLWFGTSNGGVYKVISNKKKFIRYKSFPSVFINFIEQDHHNNLWVNGIYKFNLNSIDTTQSFAKSYQYITLGIDSIQIHKSDNTVAYINDTEILTKRHYAFSVTSRKNILIATPQMIKEYSFTGTLLNRIVINDDPNSNNEDIANFIFEDASGILWLGTNSGLIKINKNKYRFTKFTTYSLHQKLNSNYVRSVFVDNNNNIWVGYKAGLVNQLIAQKGSNIFKSNSFYYKKQGIPCSAINVIRQLRSGTILLGGAAGLYYAIPSTNIHSKHFLYDYILKKGKKKSIPIIEVWSIMEDQNSNIWVGTRAEGLYIINPKNHQFHLYHYKDSANPERRTGLTSVWQIFEDHKGDIWLATNDGLDSVVINKDRLPIGFYNLQEHYKGNEGTHVWSIAEDKYKRLWMSTTDNGISMVDKKKKRFITYNHTNGLPGNITCGLLKDPHGYFWISTLMGIVKFDVDHGVLLKLSENDGLIGNNFDFNACYQSQDGQLYFGSKSGAVSFYPDSIMNKKPTNVPVLIRKITLWNGQQINTPDITHSISFKHNQNSFSLQFALTDYAVPSEHLFKYKLKGFDANWLTTDARHPIATYTNIPPGNYILQVEGSTDGNHWGDKTTMLSININPAIWQRPAFIISIIIMILFIITGIIYYQYKALAKREQKKRLTNQKIAELELNALLAQMNPHFIFNSINAIQHFIIHKDEITANNYLSKFAKLMRLFLESSKNKYISINQEIELLSLYLTLEQLRFEDKFDYKININIENYEIKNLQIPSMLIQPFIENAIKHGLVHKPTKGYLNISFNVLQNNASIIKCTIDDNGIGRKGSAQINAQKNTKHISRGTELINDRVKTYNFINEQHIEITITDKEQPETGTIVEIFIPYFQQ